MGFTEQQKWTFLEQVPAKDSQHPVIQRLASLLMMAAHCSQPPSTPVLRMRFADLAFTVARDWIRYETDTQRLGHEDVAGFTRRPMADDAVDALWRGIDDCDAKARLFVALCLAQGVAARMVPHWKGAQLAHVSAAFSIDGTAWIPVELTLIRARVGDTAADIPKEPETKKWQTT